MGLRVLLVLLDDPLVYRQGLVEFADPAEMIAPVEGGGPLLVADLGGGKIRKKVEKVPGKRIARRNAPWWGEGQFLKLFGTDGTVFRQDKGQIVQKRKRKL